MSTIERALGLLEHFSASQPEIGLTNFKVLTGYDKGTLHRYLTDLKNCGFLEQNQATRAYRLGPAVIRLSAVREKTVPIVQAVAIYIDHIADHLNELAHAALPQNQGMSAIYVKDGVSHGTRVSFDEAEILPFHATSSGMAMLSFSNDNFVDAILSNPRKRYTQTTSIDADDIKSEINVAFENGYAFANQTYEADVNSVAVPFFDHTRKALGTLAIATPAFRFTTELHKACIIELIKASTSLSRDLGGDIPPDLARIWAQQLET